MKFSGKFTRFNFQLNNSRGMTLIEILIVLVIIGGLITVLGSTVMSGKDKANQREAKIQLSELSKAIETYALDCKSYPTTEQGLHALMEAPADCKSWGPDPYTKPQLLKDPWNTEIQYESNGGDYTLKSLGKDKKEGGTGYNADITNKDAM